MREWWIRHNPLSGRHRIAMLEAAMVEIELAILELRHEVEQLQTERAARGDDT